MFGKPFVSFLIFSLSFCMNGFAQEVSMLRVEGRTEAVVTDNPKPSLGWTIGATERNIGQTAYRILAATSPENLRPGKADLWDSGKVISDRSVFIDYDGVEPEPGQECFWRVQVWTNKGKTAWSPVGKWTMGLSGTNWEGEWIGLNGTFPGDTIARHPRLSARYLRKEFEASKPIEKATAYIAVAGLYELYINGGRVGEHVLCPGPTDHTKNIRYNTFDVTSQFIVGENAVGVILGNGRYFPLRQEFDFQRMQGGFPKMLFRLDVRYTDGTRSLITSDDSWKITPHGPIRSNNEYDGEEYDARMEMDGWCRAGFDDARWMKAETVTAPCDSVLLQTNGNMAVHATVKPVSITTLPHERYILDMGRNMAGWLKIKVRGERGAAVTLRFAEALDDSGELYVANLRTARQTDVYTLKGQGIEEWEPRFVYHGFRYVEVLGLTYEPDADDFEGKLIYDEMPTIGSFHCSDPLLNDIYAAGCRTIINNFKGMPVDCPQRDERDPWLGDWATVATGAGYVYDISALFSKWMEDIRFTQRPSGQIPDVAPSGWFAVKDNMTWPGTYLMTVNMLYRRYGDQRVIKEHYPAMKNWLDYMAGKYLKNNILTADRYGDWCLPPESPSLIHSKDPLRKTDGQLIATAYFYYFLNMMSDFASVSGNEDDIPGFRDLSSEVKRAFNEKFYNPEEGYYSNNTVTANLLPLAFGLTDDRETVLESIAARIAGADDYHISSGIIGIQWLMRELTRGGREDIALRMATQTGYPGWGYMIGQGATTIWELWNGDTADPAMNSQNHVMLLGDLQVWMFEDLAGIRNAPGSVGFRRLWMEPRPSDRLTHVSASTMTPYGQVKSEWRQEVNRFTWHVTIPPNTTADILLPGDSMSDITVNGKEAAKTAGLKYIGTGNGRQHLEIGSGSYTFVSR